VSEGGIDVIEIMNHEQEGNEEHTLDNSKNITFRRPKNIKQIGDVQSDKQIYIEDYAFSYIHSLAYSMPDCEQAGVLLGDSIYTEQEKYVFIKGVIKAKNTNGLSRGIHFDEDTWTNIYEEIEKYFPDLQVIGWFAAIPGVTSERMQFLQKIHLDHFSGAMKALYLVDTCEKNENFYLYEEGMLKKQRGYVCFYERNFQMQEYMLKKRGGRSVDDTSKDDVVASIRGILHEKEEIRQQKKHAFFMYSVSSVLALVVLVFGINTMNSYEKMEHVDASLDKIVRQVSDYEDSKDVVSSEIVPVNQLSGDVYPTQESSTAETQQATTVIQPMQTETQPQVTAGSSMQENIQPDRVSGTAVQPQTESATAPVVAEPAYQTYIVKKGDTIMSICKKVYGTIAKYDEVANLNHIDDVNKLYVGQEIKLP